MPHAVPKSDAPHLNKAARKALFAAARSERIAAPDLRRDGYEAFRDAAYWDTVCVRPSGSRDFADTVHVSSLDDAGRLIDWLAGRREEIGLALFNGDRDMAVAKLWRRRAVAGTPPAG
jgi:hypothetical protein